MTELNNLPILYIEKYVTNLINTDKVNDTFAEQDMRITLV